jgi:hypothetical protein
LVDLLVEDLVAAVDAVTVDDQQDRDAVPGPGSDLGRVPALPPLNADLAVMTGNVAQVFLADDEWGQTFRGIGAALRPGGHLAFETRRPDYRAWQEWAADTGPVPWMSPGPGWWNSGVR